jgi:hypothetical protein
MTSLPQLVGGAGQRPEGAFTTRTTSTPTPAEILDTNHHHILKEPLHSHTIPRMTP